MKITTLLALSLSLALSACTAAGPSVAPQAASIKTGARESLRIKLPDFVPGFSTKAALYDDVEEIRFYVDGQGLSSSETEDTETEVDIDLDQLGEGDVSIDDIPANDGDWRIVTAVGLNSEGDEIPAFTAKAVYISDEDSTTDISFSRASLLLGLAFEELIDDDADVLDDLDEDDLEELEDNLIEMLNFDAEANRFRPETGGDWVDPLDYDPLDIAEVIDNGDLLDNNADVEPVGPFDVEVDLDDSSGDELSEDVTITIDDPSSQLVTIPAGTELSAASPDFVVSPGTWTLRALDALGDELGSTEITVDFDGDAEIDNLDDLNIPAS